MSAYLVTDIQRYVRTLYLRKMPRNAGLPDTYIRRDDVVRKIIETLRLQLADFEAGDEVDVPQVADLMFEEMVAASSFAKIDDEFAGDYYSVLSNNIQAFRSSALGGDHISARADAIGENRYFADVFAAWKSGVTEMPVLEGIKFDIPASNRIVTVSHNQQVEVGVPLEALIEDVRIDNEVLEGDIKDRLLGQLRAGNELLRAGSVRAFLLYHTLIRGLIELAARYRGRAIAIAAEKLIELIAQNIFEGNF